MTTTTTPSLRGLASADPETRKRVASAGGRASPGNFANNPERAAEAGRKGGKLSPGNFAKNPERAAAAGRKGGRARALPKEEAEVEVVEEPQMASQI